VRNVRATEKIAPLAAGCSRARLTAEPVVAAATATEGLALSEMWRADDLSPVRFRPSPEHEPVVLVRDGKPLARITVHQPGELPAAAVRDLQRFVRASTGAELPLVEGGADGPAIVVGDCPAAAKLGLVGQEMPVEGFAIRTAPGTVYIVGHGEAGTAWGVYEFLERFVGVRWYWPEERGSSELLGTSVLPMRDLVVEPAFLSDAPVFRKRHTWPEEGPRVGNAEVLTHDRRLRVHNSWPVTIRVHAPKNWARYYAKDRPEIFEMGSDGVRRPLMTGGGKTFSMLCYGDPRTLQTYLEEIELQLAARAEGAPVDDDRCILVGNAVTVSPADMDVTCHCEHCRARWNEQGGTYGTASRLMAEFVARLGREVRDRWPELTVAYLPYKNYAAAPDGVSFLGNVEVQICGMPGLALYKDPVIRASEQANIDAWFRLSGRKVQNWHYSCWPEMYTRAAYLFPHTIQNHYRANRDKTVGTFINGIKNHWPRMHLSLYVWLKVLWNPGYNVDAAIEEYCRRMYGAAAGEVRQLVGMLVDGWEAREWPNHTVCPQSVYEHSYPRRDVLRMQQLLAKARETAAGDALVGKRLDYWSWCLDMFWDEAGWYDEADSPGKLSLTVHQAAGTPDIDDTTDEGRWQNVEPVLFARARDLEHPDCEFPTVMKAAWTPDGVAFAFRMSEPSPDRLARTFGPGVRDVSPFLLARDDSVMVSLDVTGQRTGCYTFIVNADGALYDARGEDLSWNAAGLRVATAIGTDCWPLQLFIPVSAFEDAVPPSPGVTWYGNFARHRVGDGSAPEHQRFNSTYLPPDEDQNAFVPIRFL